MKSLCLSSVTLTAAATIGLSGAAASASVIAEHVGSADPDTEAVSSTNATTWIPGGIVAGETGPITGPPPSWRVSGGTSSYSYDPSPAEHDALALNGWKLSANIRVPNANETVDYQPFVEYSSDDESLRYFLNFGSNSSGQQIVAVNDTTADHTVLTSTTSSFVLYELVYDPVADTADLFINGDEEISNILHAGGSNDRVMFAGANRNGSGEGHWNLVRLEVLPEPASAVLMLLGGAVLMGGRKQR